MDRSIECVEIFDFFNGIFETGKSERSWESIAWELREFSDFIFNNLEKVKNRENSEIYYYYYFLFWFFLLKIFLNFFQIFS